MESHAAIVFIYPEHTGSTSYSKCKLKFCKKGVGCDDSLCKFAHSERDSEESLQLDPRGSRFPYTDARNFEDVSLPHQPDLSDAPAPVRSRYRLDVKEEKETCEISRSFPSSSPPASSENDIFMEWAKKEELFLWRLYKTHRKSSGQIGERLQVECCGVADRFPSA